MKAVLFDAAGVLTEPFSIDLVIPAIEAGADPQVLADTLYPIFADAGADDSVGNRLERGEVTLEAFFDAMGDQGDDIRTVVDPASPTFFGARWMPNLTMHAFVREVKAAGFATALVSNNVREWQGAWDRVVPADLPFDARVFSWEVGARKPEPAIYAHALGRLGIDASDALFLDDFPLMVEGARAVGMTAVHVTDTSAAIAEARRLLEL